MNVPKLIAAALVLAAALPAVGCGKSSSRRDDPQPAQTKAPISKEGTGVPKPQPAGPAPVGAGEQPQTAPAPATSGQ